MNEDVTTDHFANSREGAVKAFHDAAHKSVHDKAGYHVAPVGSHAWLVSGKKNGFSAVVYPHGGDAHVGRKGHPDFEAVDHDTAMKFHLREETLTEEQVLDELRKKPLPKKEEPKDTEDAREKLRQRRLAFVNEGRIASGKWTCKGCGSKQTRKHDHVSHESCDKCGYYAIQPEGKNRKNVKKTEKKLSALRGESLDELTGKGSIETIGKHHSRLMNRSQTKKGSAAAQFHAVNRNRAMRLKNIRDGDGPLGKTTFKGRAEYAAQDSKLAKSLKPKIRKSDYLDEATIVRNDGVHGNKWTVTHHWKRPGQNRMHVAVIADSHDKAVAHSKKHVQPGAHKITAKQWTPQQVKDGKSRSFWSHEDDEG